MHLLDLVLPDATGVCKLSISSPSHPPTNPAKESLQSLDLRVILRMALTLDLLRRSSLHTALSAPTSTTTLCAGGQLAVPWSCWATFALAASSWQTHLLTLQKRSLRWQPAPQAAPRWTILLCISNSSWLGLNFRQNCSAKSGITPLSFCLACHIFFWRMEFLLQQQ